VDGRAEKQQDTAAPPLCNVLRLLPWLLSHYFRLLALFIKYMSSSTYVVVEMKPSLQQRHTKLHCYEAAVVASAQLTGKLAAEAWTSPL
jgi:hypothetical protein